MESDSPDNLSQQPAGGQGSPGSAEPRAGRAADAGCIDIRFTSSSACIAPVRRAVEAMAERCGFDASATAEIGLCINEAIANIICHAYGGRGDGPIHLTAEYRDGELRMRLRDWGSGVNPSELPHRAYDPLEPGGVGLLCMQTLMHQVEYEPQDPGMLLTLVRRQGPITWPDGGGESNTLSSALLQGIPESSGDGA